jgi:hypothetical protein
MAHVPLAHEAEQHCPSDVHGCPSDVQTVAAHFPSTQLIVEQSVGPAHPPPGWTGLLKLAVQVWVAESHVPEQQDVPAVHDAP